MALYRSFKKFLGSISLFAKLRVPFLACFYKNGISALQRSYKMTRLIHPETFRLLASGKPVIFAIYHGRMGGILSIPNRAKVTILISQSRDGEAVARAMLGQGFLVARGSPAKGATAAAKTMLNQARKGNSIVMTVDGPRGPALVVKKAVIRLAQVSQLPVVPIMCDSLNSIRLPSWDSFMYPHFFTSMLCLFDQSLTIGKSDDVDASALALEKNMEKLRESQELWRNSSDKNGLLQDLLDKGWIMHQSRRFESVSILDKIDLANIN